MPYINQIELPRFIQINPDSKFDIHGFADGSQLAYGCCIYIRVADSDHFHSNLLIAKSKVAPIVQQSLPRLELCAALLLRRTWNKIKHKFESYNYRIFFWSDSNIVLSWLTKHSSSFSSTFIVSFIYQNEMHIFLQMKCNWPFGKSFMIFSLHHLHMKSKCFNRAKL